MKKYSFEEKMDYVERLLSGEPLMVLEREYHIDHHLLTQWRQRFDEYGVAGLTESFLRKSISGKEKERIVSEYLKKDVTLYQISLKYRVSRESIKNWVRLVRHRGYEALYGLKSRKSNKSMGRPKKKEPQTELEKLQAENLRLRAENALLKKAKALVEEKRARARMSGQES